MDHRTIGALMRYIQASGPGGPEVLSIGEMPIPKPGPGEVLIRVAAAGVNRPDLLQRQGIYPPPAEASPILGLEVSGGVHACGPGVDQWQAGDQVCALVNGGGYAEYALAPANQCLPVPDGLSLEDAAALPETTFTVWHNLWQRAGLQAGETLLVHGGGSGIGTTAIQIAVALGVEVLVTAGNDDKCRACEQLGATLAINYHSRDFVTAVKEHTGGRGVQVILDMVGGAYVQRNFSAAARDGRIVNIAFLQGSQVQVDLMPLMLKRLTLTGSTLRSQSSEQKARIAAELRARVWPLVAEGRVRPLIAARYPLARVAEAHEYMASNRHVGKLVLTLG